MHVDIREALLSDLEALAALFDGYRRFYEQPADLQRARGFMSERLAKQDSVVLVASNDDGELVGFTQLFPTFSSVATARTFVLNDLFVVPGYRKSGVARALLESACEAGASRGAIRLSLSTAVSNLPAQKLYEATGWTRNEKFFQYGITLPVTQGSS